MAEIDLDALKRDVLRVIEAGADRGEIARLEREVRVLFDRANAVPALIQAKESLAAHIAALTAERDQAQETIIEMISGRYTVSEVITALVKAGFK